jgi:hypothetical protein
MARKNNLQIHAENEIELLEKKLKIVNTQRMEIEAEIRAYRNLISWNANISKKVENKPNANNRNIRKE